MSSFNKLYNIVISAVCMGIAQHPLGLGWLSWFCLVPLFLSIKESLRFRDTFLNVFIWAFIYHLVSLYWLADNIGISERYIAFITMLLSNIICTVNVLIVFSIWHFINFLSGKKVWYTLPFIWTMVDYIRSLGQLSFPWASIANTQAQESLLPMIQFVELTGMFGVTFWVVSLNISILYLFINRDKNRIIESVGIFLLPLIIGLIIKGGDLKNIERINFAILQPNIHIDDKNKNLNVLDRHILKSDKHDLRNTLLIWPETAFNHHFSDNNKKIQNTFLGTNVSLLTGVLERSDKNLYNSIYYLKNNNRYSLKNAERYRKIKLVPLAEHVPFTGIFPFLEKIALSGNFSKGDEYTLFKYKDSAFGAMVCIESIYPGLSRDFVNRGAQFLVYVANDGWYLNPPEAQQHAKQTIFRAIETRKPVLRCGNTGITWVVSPDGEILKRLDHNEDGILLSDDIDVFSNNTKTLYVMIGDWIAYISMIVIFYLISTGLIRKYKK